MNHWMLSFLAWLLLVVSTRNISSRLSPHPSVIIERFPVFFLTGSALVVTTGYILSAFHKLSDLFAWTALLFIITLISWPIRLKPSQYTILEEDNSKWALDRYHIIVLTLMGITVAVIGLLNLTIVIFTAPHNWDSMTYHLARVAYFIQHGHSEPFHTAY